LPVSFLGDGLYLISAEFSGGRPQIIKAGDLFLKNESSRPVSSGSLVKPLRETEEDQIIQALKASSTVLEAADMLGIHFTTLYRRIKKYRLTKN
jgi:transcriptional regulator of acetoin/glycerol metabolism